MVPPEKNKLNHHVLSKTHIHAVEYMKGFEKRVMKNQLRTALGNVKSKAAAIQYEAAGADVGDFGHSRKLFLEMLKAFCAHIDQGTALYLSSPQPNTGKAPRFFCDS